MESNSQLEKINNVCLVIIAITAVTMALVFTRQILVPFVISFFIFSILSPFINWFEKKLKVPHFIALSVTILIFLIFFTIIFFFLGSSISEFFQSTTIYKEKVISSYHKISEILSSKGVDIRSFSLVPYFKELPLFSWANNITGSLFSFVGNSALVVVFIIFLILGRNKVEQSNELVEQIQRKIGRYIGTKLITSVSTGLLIMILLGVCRVELAFMFGVVTILLNFIPNIGSLFAVVLPLPIVLLQFGFGWQFYVVLIVSSLIQFAIGNIIEPQMVGESMDLHPIIILIFLMFWGMVWGVPGMFMAVPITAILKIVFSRIETTKKLSELLAGRF
ncbi:MAG: AI-2E family transporter [Bdellovibrionales bacterium]|nr:AI-2E family transporter [Bdellovibrionales bacterium]